MKVKKCLLWNKQGTFCVYTPKYMVHVILSQKETYTTGIPSTLLRFWGSSSLGKKNVVRTVPIYTAELDNRWKHFSTTKAHVNVCKRENDANNRSKLIRIDWSIRYRREIDCLWSPTHFPGTSGMTCPLPGVKSVDRTPHERRGNRFFSALQYI